MAHIGYTLHGNIMIITEYYYDDYNRFTSYEPIKVCGKVIDMYNIYEPTKKYYRLGSQKNKYKLNETRDILVYKSLDKLKHDNKIPESINLNVSGMYYSYHKNNNICEEYYHINYIKEGTYKKYYENNKLEIECIYVNGNIFGNYTRYNEKGKIINSCIFRN